MPCSSATEQGIILFLCILRQKHCTAGLLFIRTTNVWNKLYWCQAESSNKSLEQIKLLILILSLSLSLRCVFVWDIPTLTDIHTYWHVHTHTHIHTHIHIVQSMFIYKALYHSIKGICRHTVMSQHPIILVCISFMSLTHFFIICSAHPPPCLFSAFMSVSSISPCVSCLSLIWHSSCLSLICLSSSVSSVSGFVYFSCVSPSVNWIKRASFIYLLPNYAIGQKRQK